MEGAWSASCPEDRGGGLLGQHIEIQSFRRKTGRPGWRKKEGKGGLGIFFFLVGCFVLVLSCRI